MIGLFFPEDRSCQYSSVGCNAGETGFNFFFGPINPTPQRGVWGGLLSDVFLYFFWNRPLVIAQENRFTLVSAQVIGDFSTAA